MPTEDAISAYNYLTIEDRLVAACLIPPEEISVLNSIDDEMDAYHDGGNHEFGDTEGKHNAFFMGPKDVEETSSTVEQWQQFTDARQRMKDVKKGYKEKK